MQVHSIREHWTHEQSSRKECLTNMDANSRHYEPVGELTIFEAASFKESLVQLISNDGLVCMDLGKVTRVDTAAIQLMWAARKLGRILVTGIPQDVQTKLTQLGFSEPLSE
jgi:anti-anti-sigma regulatory factor